MKNLPVVGCADWETESDSVRSNFDFIFTLTCFTSVDSK